MGRLDDAIAACEAETIEVYEPPRSVEAETVCWHSLTGEERAAYSRLGGEEDLLDPLRRRIIGTTGMPEGVLLAPPPPVRTG